MHLLDKGIPALGMGCWPIGGPMYHGDLSIGYHGCDGCDEAAARRTLAAALDAGVRLFDTAPAYGAGHAERLMGEVIGNREDVVIITKVGLGIDEGTRRIFDPTGDPAEIAPEIDASRGRLRRDCLDIVMLHVNGMDVAQAEPIFDALETARLDGKIGAYGWSTDYRSNIAGLSGRPGVIGVEHAMNVLFDAAGMQAELAAHGLTAFLRSPLAMGLLSGRYDAGTVLPSEDVRASNQTWIAYFEDGRPNPELLAQREAVAELLQSGGRTLVQGALCWLWAKSAQNVPLPGARRPEQIIESAGAVAHGPLPASVMAEIEALIPRRIEPDRDR